MEKSSLWVIFIKTEGTVNHHLVILVEGDHVDAVGKR